MAVQQRQHLVAVGYRMFFFSGISRFGFVILRIASGCIEICAHTAPLSLPACPEQANVGTLYAINFTVDQFKYFLYHFHISSSFDISATSDWFHTFSYSMMILHYHLLGRAKEILIIAAPFYAKFCNLSRSGTFGFANH